MTLKDAVFAYVRDKRSLSTLTGAEQIAEYLCSIPGTPGQEPLDFHQTAEEVGTVLSELVREKRLTFVGQYLVVPKPKSTG